MSLLWQVYFAARHHGSYDYPDAFPQGQEPDAGPLQLIKPENGPATRQLYCGLAKHLHASAEARSWLASAYPSAASDPPEQTIAEVFRHSRMLGYCFVWAATTELYGPAASDRLLTDVALEAFQRHPKSALLFVDNFLMLLAGPNDVVYGPSQRYTDMKGTLYLNSCTECLPPRARHEATGTRPDRGFFDALYMGGYLLKPVMVLCVLICLPFGLRGPGRYFLALVLVTAVYQCAVVSVFSQAHQRFFDMVYLLFVIAAALGVHGLRRRPEATAASPGPSVRSMSEGVLHVSCRPS
jgi:hypothetical protein